MTANNGDLSFAPIIAKRVALCTNRYNADVCGFTDEE